MNASIDWVKGEKVPFMVLCEACRHEWPAFYTPLLLDKAGMKLLKSAGKAPCPKCASTKILCKGVTDAP